MENLAKQSELLFMWDAKLCNPNGDMSMDNAPRFDDVDEKAIVSDVRVKRTIRDDLQYRKSKLIYINNEEIVTNGLSSEDRLKALKAEFSSKDERSVFLSCIDNRLFGGVAPKSDIQLVGAVQFSWSKSLNKTETVLKQGTGAFATKGKEGQEKHTKTFRVDNYIPYGLFAMYGTVNRIQALKAQTTEEDVTNMLDSLWFGTKFLNTRSKEGQKPRLMLRVVYTEESKYFIGLLDELITLKNEDSETIRSVTEAEIDFTRLISAINRAEDQVAEVQVVLDDSISSYKGALEAIKKIKFMDEVELLNREG